MKKFLSIICAFIVFCTGFLITGKNNVYASQASGITSGKVYTIENVGSGKFLNPHYGYDADGINVYQWTEDGSTEQKFKFVYDSSQGAYRIYTMCSSNGTNRVLDIVKSNGSIVNGCNVEIWRPTDPYAQLWVISKNSDGSYYIKPKNNTSLYLRVVNRYNGSGSGTTSSSNGNAYIGYASGSYHKWYINEVDTSNSNETFKWAFRNYFNINQRYSSSHTGVDSNAPALTTVYSISNGTVIWSDWNSSMGWSVAVNSTDRYNGKQITIRYLHLNERSDLREGDSVTKNTIIGREGTTGYSTGYHLHLDVNTVGQYFNNAPYTFNLSNTINPENLFPNTSFTYIS